MLDLANRGSSHQTEASKGGCVASSGVVTSWVGGRRGGETQASFEVSALLHTSCLLL